MHGKGVEIMINKKGIYYLWLTLLIVTVVISCSNYFGRKNITYIQNVNVAATRMERLTFRLRVPFRV